MTLTGRQYIDWETDFGELVMLGAETRLPPKFVGKRVMYYSHKKTMYRLEQTPSDPWYDTRTEKYYSYRLWVNDKPIEFAESAEQAGVMIGRLIENQEPIDPYADLKEGALF